MDMGTITIDAFIKRKKVGKLKTYLAKCKMLCSANAGNEIENHIDNHVYLVLDDNCIVIPDIVFEDLEWYWEDGAGIITKMLIRLARYFEDGVIWLDDHPRCYIKDGKLYNIETKYISGKLLMLTRGCDVMKRKDKNFGIKIF